MKTNHRKVLSERLTLVQVALFAVVVATKAEVIDTSGCPQVCHCDKDRHVVDCGYRSLVKSPSTVPATVRHYSVAGNQIYRISAESLLGLDDLVSLDLSENFISELPNDLFRSTSQLRVLRLNGNRLESIPATSLLQLHNLQQLLLTRNKIVSLSGEAKFTSPSLLTLDLSGNDIVEVPDLFLDRFPRLCDLRLSKNHLTSVEMKKWTRHEHGLEILDMSSNSIGRITWSDVTYRRLKVFNASNNLLKLLDDSWFLAMPNLNVLQLCANLFDHIANNTFDHAFSLHRLVLCKLPNVQYIDIDSFAGLPLLQELDLSSNYNLSSIHQDAFTSLHHLQYLNIRNNRLRTLQLSVAGSNLETMNVYLAGPHWMCDCHLKWMYDAHMTLGSDIGQDIVCSAPPDLRGIPLFEVKEYGFSCKNAERYVDQIVSAHIGTTVILHCPVKLHPESEIVWTTSRGIVVQSTLTKQTNSSSEHLLSSEHFSYFVFDRGANTTEKFIDRHHRAGHFNLLKNGSLMIKDVNRRDTGHYICTMVNSHENVTVTTELHLDYGYLLSVMLWSLVVGSCSAVSFLLIAVIVGTVRHIAYSCSANERKKRRSLRELLSQMRNNSQFDRFSAYRAAQIDKLSAFKSATMDHLSSFTSHRIGRLRRYKQATVSSVLHHLERMREYYSVQMDHIKDSYRMNTARLRHNYMARFRDNKSTSVRKQYRASVTRVRDYTNEQVARLREQYKQQQQYLLKLLELIDVGSCVSSSVAAECIRAESAIFDATVEFDQEARPSYASRPDDRRLFASNSSLPDDYRHCMLPAVMPSSVDFCDVDDYHVDGVALRAASAPNVQASTLAMTSHDDPFLRLHSNSTTVYCQKSLSSPIVVNAVVEATDIDVSLAPKQHKM